MSNDSTSITPEQLEKIEKIGSFSGHSARLLHLELAMLALSPFIPATPPAYDNPSSVRQRNARRGGHMLSPKTLRPARRNAQHNPRGSRR